MKTSVALVVALLAAAPLLAQRESDVDRLEATRLCGERATTWGPSLIDFAKAARQKRGLDKPTDTWNFSAHFNREQQRCFVEMELVTHFSDERTLIALYVYDAFEGGLAVGTLLTMTETGTTTILFCRVSGTEVSEAAYRVLMTK